MPFAIAISRLAGSILPYAHRDGHGSEMRYIVYIYYINYIYIYIIGDTRAFVDKHVLYPHIPTINQAPSHWCSPVPAILMNLPICT